MTNPKDNIKNVCYYNCNNEHSYSNQYNLRTHMEGKHDAKFRNIKIKQGVRPMERSEANCVDHQSSNVVQYSCCCCYECFETITFLKDHVESEHLMVDETDSEVVETIVLPGAKSPTILETKEEIEDDEGLQMSILDATSQCLDITGDMAIKMTSLVELIELKPLILRDVTNDNNSLITYTSSKCLKRHLSEGEGPADSKRYKVHVLKDKNQPSTICPHIKDISRSNLLNHFIRESPYRNLLAYDSFNEITVNQIKQLNYTWKGHSYMCQFVGVRLSGMILIDGNQALLVNSIEVYSRFRTLDAHHERFNGDHSENSLPLLSNKYDSDIRITKIDNKLLIGTSKMNILVVSSIRIDSNQYAPEVGPYTSNFIPSENCSLFLSNKSTKESNEILAKKVYTIQPDQEILSHLKQVQSKYNKPSTYNISRFHYIHTSDLTTQPFTIFTLADSDSLKETDDIIGSQLFQIIGLAMYDSKKLKKSDVKQLVMSKQKETTVNRLVKNILGMYKDSTETIDIIGNKALDMVLRDIAKIIVKNGLKDANKQTINVIKTKFYSSMKK